ncbi:MAG: hypothetical protein ABI886_07300 [Betaproteobacteria bacterium]
MRNGLFVLWMLLCSITTAAAQVSVGIGFPGVSIGINLPVYPQFVRVPGYPVYYAPQVRSNYFFYDGMYWVYQSDNWYASSWYNGPWGLVAPDVVPLYVLRVPVRYYRQPPVYFSGWRSDAPPRWGEHWGHTWEQSHGGWDRWNRNVVPAPAPLPAYQRQYSGNRYPRVEQQHALQSQNYRYRPRDAVVQQHYQAQRAQSAPVQAAPASAPPARQAAPQQRSSSQQGDRGTNRPPSPQQGAAPAPHGPPPRKGGDDVQKPAAAAPPPHGDAIAGRQMQQPAQHAQQAPKSQGQDKGPQGKAPAKEPKQGREKDREQGEQRGGEHNK